MKIKHLIPTALAAIVAIAAPVAHAALTYSPGNLYLALRQVGNNTSDFAVNIGAAATYRDALSPVTLTLSNLSSTLDSIFNTTNGAWATNPNVQWSIFGTTYLTNNVNGDPRRVLYIGEPTGSTPLQADLQTAVAGTMIDAINYYSNGAATGITSGLTESAVTNGSVGSPGNERSATSLIFTGTPFLDNDLAPAYATITSGLELYRVPQTANGAVTKEGTFTLSGNNLTFTPVPEASTYAFMFFGTMGFVIVAIRHFRKTKTA